MTERRRTIALAAMAVLVIGILAFAPRVAFRGTPSVDSRTYVEMTRGFAENGLPYLENGPSSVFPEMRARWNVVRGGHLWGIYPPLFPFLGSFAFRAGGILAVSRANFAVSALLIALGSFALGRRFARDPIAGAAAAYVSLFATFIGALLLGLDSFGLVTGLATWSCALALRAVDVRGRAAIASVAGAGVFGGAAVAAHLLALPILGGALLVVALAPFAGERQLLVGRLSRLPPSLRRWLPSKPSIARAAVFGGSALLTLAPVAALNVMRFGTPSPVTYGQCVWRTCFSENLKDMTLGNSVAYAVPVFVWISASLALLFALRRRAGGRVVWLVVTIAAYFVWPALYRHGRDLFQSTVAYLIDSSPFSMEPFFRPDDGLGNLFGPFVIKSLVQGSPFVALAAIAPWILRGRGDEDEPQRIGVLYVPVLALVVLLALRGNLRLVHALGFPFLFLRYLAPAMPLLAVLAVTVSRRAGFGLAGLAVLVVVAVLGFLYLRDGTDFAWARRFLILRVTIAVGAAAAVLALLRRRRERLAPACGVASGLAFGLAVAISLGVDFNAIWRQKLGDEEMLARIERHVPARFALVGWSPDPALALRATHDIEYMDFLEADGWTNFGSMMDRWRAEGRPVFGIYTPERRLPWPDVTIEVLDPKDGLVRVVKKD